MSSFDDRDGSDAQGDVGQSRRLENALWPHERHSSVLIDEALPQHADREDLSPKFDLMSKPRKG
jgi:hypothetical protein